MTYLLDKDYVVPIRPYSQKELLDNRQQIRKRLHLGQTFAEHEKCGHFYLVKENGRKEKNIKENNCTDSGNCSVCWKYSKTSKNYKDRAGYLINDYCEVFVQEPKRLNHEQVDLENVFYYWLYEN
jgi:hypothetical protein